LDIAGTVFSFEPEKMGLRRGQDGTHCCYRKFLTRRKPHCRIAIHEGIPPDLMNGTLVQDTDSFWQVVRSGGRCLLRISPLTKRGAPRGVLALERRLSRGEFHLGASARRATVYGLVDLVLRHLTVTRLAGQGLLLHAAARRGAVFVGNSGAGKTTLFRVLRRRFPSGWLSDDRVILRRALGRWRVFGTPWHGTDRIAAQGSSPLSTLFLLRQAKANGLRKLSRLEAVAALFRACFTPYWSEEGVAAVLRSCDELASAIPAWEFSFKNDESAADFLTSPDADPLARLR